MLKDCGMKEKYNTAFESLVEKLKQDSHIISVMLCGSLAYDEVWEKSDIDVILITDDEKRPFQIKSLTENDIVINAFIYSRNEFRKAFESSVQSDMFHSWFSKSKLIYTKDDVIKEYYDNICRIGESDKEIQLLKHATYAVAGLAKAEKWFKVKNDLLYSFTWITKLTENLASIEVISNDEIPLREVVHQAIKYNPDFFNAIYSSLIQKEKNKETIENALELINNFIKSKTNILFTPLVRFLKQAGNEKTVTEINEYLGKRINIDPTLLVEACEWLVEMGIAQKLPIPVRLTSKSRVMLDEAAYYILEGIE